MKSAFAKYVVGTITFALATGLFGCTGGDSGGDLYLQNMNDFSYGGRRDKVIGTSASGETVKLSQYSGKFVWVDFSAPWCGPCRRQASVIKNLESRYTDRVVFLTLMTSDNSPREPATVQTALAWAKQYGLDPRHVMTSSERTRVIPTHLVFSPAGQTLYFESGVHSESLIKSRLAGMMREWNTWRVDNEGSISVLLSDIEG